MFNFQRLKALSSLKGILRESPTPQCFRLLQPYPSPAFSLEFSTRASPGNHSFTVSYLINSLGFSQEDALNASKRVQFQTSKKPDSVVSSFRSYGFSESLIYDLIRKNLLLLTWDPHKRILPKFEFLLSKGASISDIALIAQRSTRFLERSLTKHIIPSYELLIGFLHSDEAAIDCIKGYPDMLYDTRLIDGIKMLHNNGVSITNVAIILGRRPRILAHCPHDLMKVVQEIKCLGFNPSNIPFSVALIAKMCLSKSRWEAKVDVYKKWGWSEEAWAEAFRKQPHIMLASEDKINAVMSFWSNHLGWSTLDLVKGPNVFGHSLKKRIIPRAAVLDYLQSKGLIKKNASLVVPFGISEERFLEKFVKCYGEHNHLLLTLYEENKEL